MFSETPTPTFEGSPGSDVPVDVTVNQGSRTLTLAWPGMQAVISHRVLRRSCRCSVCESMRRSLNDPIPVAHDISLRNVEVLGSVGLRLFFSDEHDRGIYPWAYLRQIVQGPVAAGFPQSLMKGWRDE